MHGDDSWKENKNTRSLWNKHSFNPFKQAAMSLCHDSSHNNLHSQTLPRLCCYGICSIRSCIFRGWFSWKCFIPRKKFPHYRWHDFSWQKSINLSTRIYVKLSAVVQMDRIAAHSCSFYPLVLYDLRYCKHKLRERGVNFKFNLNGNFVFFINFFNKLLTGSWDCIASWTLIWSSHLKVTALIIILAHDLKVVETRW